MFHLVALRRPSIAFWLIILLIVSGTILVYRNSLSYFFWQDDFVFLRFVAQGTFADYVDHTLIDPKDMVENPLDGRFRPLSNYLYWKLLFNLFELDVLPYRYLTFLFLLSNGFLVALLYKVACNERFVIALLAGLIYMISRVQFTPVYWIATSAELLMTFFILVSVLSYLGSSEYQHVGQSLYFLSIAALVLALFSKENAVMVPGLIAATFLLRVDGRRIRSKFTQLYRLWPHVLAVFIFVFLRIVSLRNVVTGEANSYYSLNNISQLLLQYLWGLWWNIETFVEPWRTVADQLTVSFSLFQPLLFSVVYLVSVVLIGFFVIGRKLGGCASQPVWLGLFWFAAAAFPALVTGILADYLFSLSAVGFALTTSYIMIYFLRRFSRGILSFAILYVTTICATLLSAGLLVNRLEQNVWPTRYMPITQATILSVKKAFEQDELPPEFCLINFPHDAWWPNRADAAFRLFFHSEVQVHDAHPNQPDHSECTPGAINIIYDQTNGTISVIP